MRDWITRSIVERIVAAVYAFFGLDLPTCGGESKDARRVRPPTKGASLPSSGIRQSPSTPAKVITIHRTPPSGNR
jgi:hypothetical protein